MCHYELLYVKKAIFLYDYTFWLQYISVGVLFSQFVGNFALHPAQITRTLQCFHFYPCAS